MSRQALRFGLSLPNRAVLFGYSPELLLEAATLADEGGQFDSVWVGDNFLSKPRLEAITTLSALAARTRRVRLGVICMASFPLRDPLLLALQWASLDVLSGGRTILGVCIGGSSKSGPQFAAELAAEGVLDKERVPRLVESVELLRRFWSAEPVTYHGRFHSYENVEVLPKPVQARIPITIASNPRSADGTENEARALRRVAQLGDGWQCDGTPPHVFRDRWDRIRGFAAEYGRSEQVTDAALHLMVNINADRARAWQESVQFLERYYGIGAVSAEKMEAWLAVGPPSAVVERIQRFAEAGCTTAVLRFTSSDQTGQVRRCMEDVLPAFVGTPVAVA